MEPGTFFARRALIVIGLTLLVVMLALLTWYASSVWLLAFFGVLLGVLLKGLADQVRKRTRLGKGWSLAIVVAVLLGALGGLTVVAGKTLIEQGQQLSRELPDAYDAAMQKVGQWPIVGPLVGAGGDPATRPAKTDQQTQKQFTDALHSAVPRVGAALSTVLGTLANFVVSLVTLSIVAIYIAATPDVYAVGVVSLFPKPIRPRVREVLSTVVYTLQQWLLGQGLTMLVIGVITAAGLFFIGVKLWLLFGVLAALFNFIPNFGPLISFLPAILVAWADSPEKAWWVMGLYVLAQGFEGYVLTPMVQNWAVNTPPALLIVSQVLFGVLFGMMGVMMAAPLLSVLLVLVKLLWMEDVLRDESDAADDEPKVQRMVSKLRRAQDQPKTD